MTTTRIRVAKGAEIIHPQTGRIAYAPHAFLATATIDPASGCAIFRMPQHGEVYVMEFAVLPKEARHAA